MSDLPLIPVGAETACSGEEDEPDLLHGHFVPDYQDVDMELPSVVATEVLNMQRLKAAAKKAKQALGYLTPEQKRLKKEQAQEEFNRAKEDFKKEEEEYRAARAAVDAAEAKLKKALKL